MDSGNTTRSCAVLGLMGDTDKYYVIYEPQNTDDAEPYSVYGEKLDDSPYILPIFRLSFNEVRWIMAERIRKLGGEPNS